MSIVIILILILLNGYFSLAEIGLVAVKEGQLNAEIRKGNRQAAKVLKLVRDPATFLSVVQVGITIVGIVEGIYGGQLVGEMLSPVLQKIPGVTPAMSQTGALVIGIGLITYLTIVLGELLPKSIALQIPLRVAIGVAPSLLFFSRLAFPFVKLLTYSTRFLLEKLHIHTQEKEKITESDLKKMLSLALNQGVLNKDEYLLHQNVFTFDHLTASRIMKPAAITRTVQYENTRAELIEYIKPRPYSHFPVRDNEMKIIGLINTKEILLNSERDWHSLIRPACNILPSIKASDIFMKFSTSDHDFGTVVNEQGDFIGIVTMQDIMEGVFGDLPERETFEKFFYEQPDGSWIAYGFIHLQRIRRMLSLEWMREYESLYITVAELLAGELRHWPAKGERITIRNLTFIVEELSPQEIGMVRIELTS